jgi:hypothetical protein
MIPELLDLMDLKTFAIHPYRQSLFKIHYINKKEFLKFN